MYKIEIWIRHNKKEEFTAETRTEILSWYVENWYLNYQMGFCSFALYKDDKRLDTLDEVCFDMAAKNLYES